VIDDSVIAEALASLAGTRHVYCDAVELVPKRPGLYAIYGDERAWTDLGLTPIQKGRPLYVGKAERSLNGRDVRTHFAPGKTGSSTVRRSLAALLQHQLTLAAVPRNLAKPDGSANFALEPESEARLSEWMAEKLSLATWTMQKDSTLDEIESVVVRRLRPPLNLDKVGESRQRLREARKRMADTARAWRPYTDSSDGDEPNSA
jgi:hypothetical protein